MNYMKRPKSNQRAKLQTHILMKIMKELSEDFEKLTKIYVMMKITDQQY